MLRAIVKLIKYILIIILVIFLAVIGSIAYARFVEPYWLSTTHETYTDSNITKDTKIALFADTHFSEYYTPKRFEKVIDEINAEKPDIILFGGDLIDELNSYQGDPATISRQLSRLKAQKGKYAVFGNHDYGGGAENEYENIMTAGGFKVLVNSSHIVKDLNTKIIGIDDFLIGYGEADTAKVADKDMFNLVICHEPDIVNKILNTDTDLMLSGHTHGGQIHVPTYTQKFLPSYGKIYVKGQYDFDNVRKTTLYVTKGIGMTKIPFRFLSRPEISFITVKRAP